MKKLILASSLTLAFLTNSYALDRMVITPVKPLPAKIVQGKTIAGLDYQVKNESTTATYTPDIVDLNGDGITYTDNCKSLSPGETCDIIMQMVVPTLPEGVTSLPYIHWFGVKGAPTLAGYILQSTIIASGSPDVTPEFDIGLSNTGVTTPSETYTVDLEDETTSQHYNFPNLPLGNTTASSAIPPDNYVAKITPASVTGSDSKTYEAPSDQDFHITVDGQKLGFTYTQNTDESVNTDLTAPNLTGTVDIKAVGTSGEGTFEHSQSAGTNPFDTMKDGKYTVSAASYTGSDSKDYVPTLNNPYTIDSNDKTISITYAEKPPSTESVSTDITAPELATGKTVHVDANDGAGHDYAHDQPDGTHTFDNMLDGSYTVSADTYKGTDGYTYVPSYSNPYVIDPTHTTITITYNKQIPPGKQYDWHASHLDDLKAANVSLIMWGGGSTTAPVHISTNPPVNPWLNTQIETYESGTPTPVQSTAQIKGLPAYIAMGTISEADAQGLATAQLEQQKLDVAFHYEGDGHGDRGCFFDEGQSTTCTVSPFGYKPVIIGLITQALAVKQHNNHTLLASPAFYTIDFSDGDESIRADIENDDNLTRHLYNLMYEVYYMENQFKTNGTQTILFLNADGTFPFQKCAQWYCPDPWQSGLSQDTSSKVLASPNLRADMKAAFDRMVAKGYLTSSQETTYLSNLDSSGILVPPPATKRTVPGLPEDILANNWIIKTLAPDIPFGWGINGYDNNNPMLNPDGQSKSWQTASITWLHKVNHDGLSETDRDNAINLEATKLAVYLKQVNMVGDSKGNYKPDFIFFDKYERDPIPGFVSPGFAFNGPDWDTYLQYIKDTDVQIDNMPVVLFQMPGASLQTEGASFQGNLAGTVANWVFGDPQLNNDFSNIASALGIPGIAFDSTMSTSVYFTQNSNVKNLQDYLELGEGSP